MVILGYPGGIAADSGTRWLWWGLSMIPFTVIIYNLFFGLKKAVDLQPLEAKGLVNSARFITVASWCFYPLVFTLPMLGVTGGVATTTVQVGYTVADIVAKAFFGVLIHTIAARKPQVEGELAHEPAYLRSG